MKKLLGFFLLLLFWQALDIRFDASVLGGCEAFCLEAALELDETAELDTDDLDTREIAGKYEPVDDKMSLSLPGCAPGLVSAAQVLCLTAILSAQTARWRSSAAETGSSIPLFLLYHQIKGY